MSFTILLRAVFGQKEPAGTPRTVVFTDGPRDMSKGEKYAVREFAKESGHHGPNRSKVWEIYSYYNRLGVHDTPEMRFLSEVFNPVPDLALRAHYRQELLSDQASRDAEAWATDPASPVSRSSDP